MKKILIIAGVLIAVMLGLGLAGYAYAQSQNPPQGYPSAGCGMQGGWIQPEGPDGFGPGMMGRGGFFGHSMMGRRGVWGPGMMGEFNGAGPMHEYMEEALAAAVGLTHAELDERLEAGENLPQIFEAQGIDPETIPDVMLQARSQALQQMVEDEVITQAQADQMLEHMNGVAPGMFSRRGNGKGLGACSARGDGPLHIYMVAAVAEALSLTPEEVQASLDAGQTMRQIAEENGFGVEQFQDLMLQAREQAVAQAVADGVLTQAQADWMLAHIGQGGCWQR